MKHPIARTLWYIFCAACGYVTGRMMAAFLPVEAQIVLAAILIPVLIVMSLLEIINAVKLNRFIRNLEEGVEKGAVKIE